MQTTSAVGGEGIVCRGVPRTTSSAAAPAATICSATPTPTFFTRGTGIGSELMVAAVWTAPVSTP
jgi:hypothetical protein